LEFTNQQMTVIADEQRQSLLITFSSANRELNTQRRYTEAPATATDTNEWMAAFAGAGTD